MTNTTLRQWSDERDDAHPIRWTPASGDEPDRWTTLDNAVDRLAGYGHDRDMARVQLLAGRELRTTFAHDAGTAALADA